MTHKRINITMNEGILKCLDIKAAQYGMSRSSLIALCVTEHLTQKKNVLWEISRIRRLLERIQR
jgi:metal-responsive CopG/Arc/MetJ family transcriptional regulator